jgi:hypothetical protein
VELLLMISEEKMAFLKDHLAELPPSCLADVEAGIRGLEEKERSRGI